MKTLFVFLILLSFLFHHSSCFIMIQSQAETSQDKCCISCSLPLIKYYSLAQHRCGESCIDPKDYWKFKIFEPHMEKAQSNTPCVDYGYAKYWETEVHAAGSLKVAVDLYNHTKTA